MYRKVIVPLDGSRLAEVVLPHLEEMAEKFNSEIMLVSVTEEIKGKVPRALVFEETSARDYHMPPARGGLLPVGSSHTGIIPTVNPSNLGSESARMGRMAKTASNYLINIARQLEVKGFKASISVLQGNPAEQIVRFAKDQQADLIIMASRGKSGFNRWDMGNIADKVIRATDIPVTIVKPGPGFKETKSKRRGKPT